MRRREVITLLGGVAATPLLAPRAACAQQPAMPVVGRLSLNNTPVSTLAAFHAGLKEAGFVEGQNVRIEYRWAEHRNDRLAPLAAELVRRQVAVIATSPGAAAHAAKAATTTIPIVFNTGDDPVQSGLVTSLARPGGNLTGVTSLNVELAPKRLELLRELVPATSSMALLVNPANPSAATVSRNTQAAARNLGLELHVLNASADGDFDAAFADLRSRRAAALVIGTDPVFISRAAMLGEMATRHAMPAIFQNRQFAAAGGLMSYSDRITDRFRLVGIYTGRILKGERPADLPVQQTTKFELIINLKTAKALGITVPLPLLAFADEVIE
jgi:putative tryptophan/tyrosine transport system substrate-binding protein